MGSFVINMFKRVFFISIFLAVAFVSIGLQRPANKPNTAFLEQVVKTSWIDSVANSLSTDEKIAQFFMPAIYSNRSEAHKNEIINLVKTYNIGGVIFFQGAPDVQARWVNELQSAAKTPLMVSIDGEWGINMRLENTIKYPRQLTLGAIKEEQLIYDMGVRIAKECKAVGVNINLAPVMDVNNNPDNPVINDRSFGEDKMNVALKSMAYMEGMQSQQIMAVGKHFPGHGDTDKDSHLTLPVINHDMERLEDIELFPFKAAFANGLQGVMAAHLFIPALDNTPNRAVSLSKKVTTELLRDSMGFDGLVFSDALNMKGVSAYYAPGTLDKEAFLAGNDILLFSEDIPKGISLIKQALENGEISQEYLNQRLKRVLEYKYDLGLSKINRIQEVGLSGFLKDAEAISLRKKLYESAITIVNNEDGLYPLNHSSDIKTATLTIGKGDLSNFQTYLSGYRNVSNFVANKDITAAQVSALVGSLSKYDQVVVSVYGMSRYSSKNYGFSANELQLLKDINEVTKVGLVLFGSPYSLKYFDDFKNIVVAYEENGVTELAAANAINGAATVNGSLPVSAGRYVYGQGVELMASGILEYGVPEEVLPNSYYLKNIDNIAQKALDLNATPGCQILVARHGKIIYEKAFGSYTYDNYQSVNNGSVYDVASITKVAATTLSIMKLYEQGLIDIEASLNSYLFGYDDVAVGNLKIKDVMLHEAGLPSWIPFYASTIDDTVYSNWYQRDSSYLFSVPVAENLYACRDSCEVIWNTIKEVTIKENPEYRYSDLGFYLLKSLVEQVSGMPFEDYTNIHFYEPMGLQRTTFLPRKKFDLNQIVPTETDEIFRNQTIHGFVHDPGAAMLGGVSGHAGLFSNAHDMAAIMQMLLNGGSYNGAQLLQPTTIEYFTSDQSDSNRRGIGFDKPVKPNSEGVRDGGPTCPQVSDLTFGHTGFTGTAAWTDPVHGLVYVFLSNRVYPNASNNLLAKENIRTDIQSEIYKSIGIFEEE